MIIITQDKKQIVNFNNTEIIFLKQNEVWYQGVYAEGYQLGRYSTEKRAKEVLTQIVYRYSAVEMYKVTDSQTKNAIAQIYLEKDITPYTFEMPEK